MLDNLKLGYGGTKSEMERLLKDADALSESFNLQTDSSGNLVYSYADIVDAIHIVQDEMGVAGATALEAGLTISGSVGSMKAAWTNLLTGLADGNADVASLVNDLVVTIVGDGSKENLGVIGNVLPAIETAIGGIGELIKQSAPTIAELFPGLVNELLPSVLSAATSLTSGLIASLPSLLQTIVSAIIDNAPILISSGKDLVKSLIDGIKKNHNLLIKSAIEIIEQISSAIIELLPEIIDLGLQILLSFATAITENISTIIPAIVSVITQIATTMTSPETLTQILNVAVTLITQLAYGLMEAIPQLFQVAVQVITDFVTFMLTPDNMALLLQLAVDIMIAIAGGLVSAIPELITAIPQIVADIIEEFANADWGQIGTDLVEGFKQGIKDAWDNLKEWFSGLFSDLIGIAKRILGIKSPSRVFKKLGIFSAEGFGIGFEDEFEGVKKDIEKSLDFGNAGYEISSSVRQIGSGSGSNKSSSGILQQNTVRVVVTIDENVNALGLARELLPYLKIASKEAYAL